MLAPVNGLPEGVFCVCADEEGRSPEMRQTDRTFLSFCVTFVSFLLMFSGLAFGQVEFGSMVGNVTDVSGGAIPDAVVKITQTTTNDTRSVLTNPTGAYTIATVTPGRYRVEITRDGFSTFVAT